MKELVYSSPFGRVRIISQAGGLMHRCPDDVVRYLSGMFASGGTKLPDPLYVDSASFDLLEGCMAAMTPVTKPERMLCRAAGYVLNEYHSCQMPHGHEGECDWKARELTDAQLRAEYTRRGFSLVSVVASGETVASITDDQLRAECERRKLISGDFAIVDLVRATDEGLRRECERRGMNLEGAPESALRERVAACDRERDSLQKALSAIDKVIFAHLPDGVAVDRAEWLKTALDESTSLEWKRRAEKAEQANRGNANAALKASELARVELQDKYDRMEADRNYLAKQVERCTRDHIIAGWCGRGDVLSEGGPGITDRNIKPDNSIAHLDEDLLCDDAP